MKPADSKTDALRREGLLNPHPERVRDPAFQGSAFFDPRDLLQVRYEMLRRVARGESSQSAAARRFGVTRMTFHRVRAAFAERGLAGLVPARRGPRGPRKITPEIRRFAADYRRRHGRVGATRLARAIEAEFGLRLHPRSLERALPRTAKKTRGRNARERPSPARVRRLARALRRRAALSRPRRAAAAGPAGSPARSQWHSVS